MIFPKKEILFAPMLGTLGGGSMRSFGRGTGEPALYDFTQHTFTPCGKVGRTGPSLSDCRSGYNITGPVIWDNDVTLFDVTLGIQKWTVPASGNY